MNMFKEWGMQLILWEVELTPQSNFICIYTKINVYRDVTLFNPDLSLSGLNVSSV